jgi:Holliday junction resolvase
MRRAARRDTNETAIVQALEAAGCTIARLSGPGVPDLLCLRQRRLTLIEVKDGAKAKSRQQLTPDQVRFHQRWAEAPLVILRSVPDAIAWLCR